VQELPGIEAIKRLKYAYFRLLDLKRFTELGELLTEDATTAYQSGELRQSGREARGSRFSSLSVTFRDHGMVTDSHP